jgi:uncharacterized protein (TIGR02246 family)
MFVRKLTEDRKNLLLDSNFERLLKNYRIKEELTMNIQLSQPQGSHSPDEIEVRALYRRLLDGWNKRNADAFAATFTENGESIGFDGSQMTGRAEIASTLQQIFADHPTPAYVNKVKSVCLLGSDVAILRAIVGMARPGHSGLEPQLNTHQTLVATRSDGTWRVVLFQNTPAQFHGRPELVQQMTEELQQLLR